MKEFVDESVAEFIDSGGLAGDLRRVGRPAHPEDQQQGPPDITLKEALKLFPLE